MRSGIALATLLALGCLAAAADTNDTCTDLGFTPDLECQECQRLQEIVADPGLTEECLSCCREAGPGEVARRFDSAVLEVCKYRMREFPGVQDFLDNHAQQFPSLKPRFRFGRPPLLLLRGAESGEESLRIDKWKSDSIVEYLSDRLPRTAAVAAAAAEE